MARADRVSFLFQRPLVAVRASINEREEVTLVVDTGAERTVISRRVAGLLGLDLTRPLRLQALAGVGRSPPVPVVRLDRLRVGASMVAGVEASVYDLSPIIGADGLLGLNFLRRFRATFEFDSQVLVLRDPARAAR
jgi:clan AA aspartic protease (TIGR02281 family)